MFRLGVTALEGVETFSKMLNTKQKIKIGAALAALLLFAFGVGCSGFFVNPTLSSITITPASPSLTTVGQQQQLTATGTYSDGTTQNITASSGTAWTSSDTTAVTVNNTGLIKAVSLTATSSVTITVTNTSSTGAVSGTATVCVGSTCTTSSSITVTCDGCIGNSISLSASGGTVQFTASQNGTDVSPEATWTSSNSGVVSITSNGGGIASLVGTGNATITANVSGAVGSVTISVTQ
jgi:Bacterial Ig-like domain (group 2)